MYGVLIIEDEPWSREVVKALGKWENLKARVIGEADNGSEGLRLIAKLQPDIVITDMRMPGIEGAELLKAIDEQFPEVKIIVMSGYDDFSYMKQAIRSQAVDYLLKPLDAEELNASLCRCIEEIAEGFGDSPDLGSIKCKDDGILDPQAVQAFIDGHFHQPISLSSIAQRFFVSKEHLSRTFKADVGENISEYIKRKRMEKAKELLVHGEMEIKHVSEAVGYNDTSYFYRVFKTHFGITPGKLRADAGVGRHCLDKPELDKML
ncbi:MAG: response regulator [Firmicutes bacterium]|nr:response regulator [Bacillota bacterium]